MTGAPLPDDGYPHARELAAASETGAQHLIVAKAQRCDRCGASLPPDAAPCDGLLMPREPLAAVPLEEIEWRNAEGERVHSRAPKLCVERYRGADGKVRWPRAGEAAA